MSDLIEGYITVNEAARRLGRSIEQVRRYLREGQLPGRRIGGQWFIEEGALAAWRPVRRPAAPHVREPIAKYEARTMKTKEQNEADRPFLDPKLETEIDRLLEEIFREHGEINVAEAIRKDREEH
jgi:excisionase family DNA binding protein